MASTACDLQTIMHACSDLKSSVFGLWKIRYQGGRYDTLRYFSIDPIYQY